jgi:hypothetical protein
VLVANAGDENGKGRSGGRKGKAQGTVKERALNKQLQGLRRLNPLLHLFSLLTKANINFNT